MPEIGDVKQYKSRHIYIWCACTKCGKVKWTRRENGTTENCRCASCAAKGRRPWRSGSCNPRWKGGRINLEGYVAIKLQPDDFFYPMCDDTGYVREHRLIMAKHLGRCLSKSETVHHKNGVKDDNRLENLELISLASHNLRSKLCSHCELRKEIRMLRWELKQLKEALQGKMLLAGS